MTIKTAGANRCMGSYMAGLIIGRIFASEIWGAYFRDDLFLEVARGGGGGGGNYRNFMVYKDRVKRLSDSYVDERSFRAHVSESLAPFRLGDRARAPVPV